MGEKPVSLIAYQYAKPGRRDELAVKLARLSEASRKEDGCLTYEVHALKDDPNVFVLFETWASQAALDQHFNADNFQRFWSARLDYLKRDVEVKFLTDL
ncbi:putative quinol monooxygenase [Aminobacter sp. MSH1]|uniref:putative quinol monooxygenase n=1 Tax=Aminobacter sp. MSH1 TaxID=374606 RepID=UPI00131EEC3D|nr:putative quinol monooxygenase [Aminobacter sp. MSH1]